MNDTYIILLIIIILIVLVLVFILISYFYNSYNNNKVIVNDNLVKTKDYINNTTTTINANIKETKTNIDKVDMLLSNKINKNTTDISLNSNDITTIKNNMGILSNVVNTTGNNINNYDKNMKQFIEFKNNYTTINDALYNYRFEVVPSLSMNFLRNITAVAGMTVKTDTTNNTMRICDNSVDDINCVDMNINKGSFDIYPSGIKDNNVKHINIYNKDKSKSLAHLNLEENKIFLGGENENAGLYIKDNDVYVKNLNFLVKDGTYNGDKAYFDKSANNLNQNYNTYKYDINDIVKLNQLSYSITGIYTIIKGADDSANNIIFNMKSIYDIPTGKKIDIEIPEIGNIELNKDIVNVEGSSSSFIDKGVLNGKKITFTTIAPITANTNIRIKLIEPALAFSASFSATDNYISNTILTLPL